MFRKLLKCLVAIAAAAVLIVPMAIGAPSKSKTLTAPEVFTLDMPYVVGVSARDRSGNVIATGTGVVVGKGTVVTCEQFIVGAHSMTINFPDGRSAPVVGVADVDDASGLMTVMGKTGVLKPLKIGPEPAVGSHVVVISNPTGGASNVSSGVVTGIQLLGKAKVISTTAAVSASSSGSALFDMHGQLIGIVFAMESNGRVVSGAASASHIAKIMPKNGETLIPVSMVGEHDSNPPADTNQPDPQPSPQPDVLVRPSPNRRPSLAKFWKFSDSQYRFVGTIADVDGALKAGADPDERWQTWTALGWAAATGTTEAVRLLIAAGANLEAKDDILGYTPLIQAVLQHHPDVVKILLDAGANKNVKDKFDNTALMLAIQEDVEAVTRILLAAKPDLEAPGVAHSTALAEAAVLGKTVGAGLLLDAGANVEATDDDGDTPLLQASYSAPYELVKLLLDHHASVTVKGASGQTVVLSAAEGGKLPSLRALIAAGASVSDHTNDGMTPLGTAATKGFTAIAEALLDAGAPVDDDTGGGNTALARVAHDSGSVDLAKLLIAHGADVNHQVNGKSLVAIAREAGHAEVADLLIKAGATDN